MDAPDLAIVVTSFEMPRHLRWVLESISAQNTLQRLEVIVADDGSRDETPRVVADYAQYADFPLRFVTHPHQGFHAARCRNEGVRHSTAPHLLFVDGDCLLPPDHVEQHLAIWRPGTVTCGYCARLDESSSRHVTIEAVRGGKFQAWASPEQRKKLRTMHRKALWYRLIGHPTKPAFRSGDFSISREDFYRVNGFDENFIGWGCEDDDIGRRLRSAGLRLVSVLNRTFVYHVWHTPAPSRPPRWRDGRNVAYLQREIRLTRCIAGCGKRTAEQLTVRLADEQAGGPELEELLAMQRWLVETSPTVRTDLELLCFPGRGAFGARSDCRVLAVFEPFPTGALEGSLDSRGAHVVLSPGGNIGEPGQVRLRLDDVEGLWSLLSGRSLPGRRMAA
jgi:glycosyltransferase involved in cell wall biosynthesis